MSLIVSKAPSANSNGTLPWSTPTGVYMSSNSYATATWGRITKRAAGAIATGTTSVAPSQPAGTTTGDVLLAFILDHSTTNGQSAAPTGWQARGYAYSSGYRFQLFSAVVGQNSLSGTSWTFGTTLTTRACGVIIGYYNVDKTGYGGLDTSVSVRHNASGTYGTASITSATAYAMIVAAFGAYASGATWSSESCATIGALAEEFDGAYSTYCSIAIADQLLAVAGSTGASTATPSAAGINGGIMVALKPLYTVPAEQIYSGFGLLTFDTITKVEIGVEAYATATQHLNVLYSVNNGGAWTWCSDFTQATSDPNSIAWQDITADRAWTSALLADGSFLAKIQTNYQNGNPTWYVDYVAVRVTYNETSTLTLFAGATASARASSSDIATNTFLNNNSPAAGNGTVTGIDVYIKAFTATGVKVGSFSGSGTSWTIRNQVALGNLNIGLNQIRGLSLAFVAGDIIGIKCDAGTGNIEYGSDAGAVLYYAGDGFAAGAKTYTNIASAAISLAGLLLGGNFYQAVGGGSITPAGNNVRKTKVAIGLGTITPTGNNARKTKIAVGGSGVGSPGTGTFGYLTQGGSNDPWAVNYMWGYRFTAPADAYTVASITFKGLHTNEAGCTCNFKGVLIDALDLSTIVATGAVSDQVTDQAVDRTSVFSSPVIIPGHSYYAMAVAGNFAGGDASARCVPYYDTGEGTGFGGYASNSYASPTAPGSLTDNGNRKYSSWITYNKSSTFGNTTTPTYDSTNANANTIMANGATYACPGGTGIRIVVLAGSNGTLTHATLALYDTASPANLIATSSEITVTASGFRFYVATFTATIPAGNYYIAVNSDNAQFSLMFDVSGTNFVGAGRTYASGFPSTVTWSTYSGRVFGLFCQFLPAASGVTIAGSVSTKFRFTQIVGAGAVAIAGTFLLLKVKLGVGGGAVNPIAGNPAKKIKLAMGAGAVTSAGGITVHKKFITAVGAGAVAMASTVALKIKLAIGGGSVTSAGAPTVHYRQRTNVGAGSITPAGDPGRKTKLTIGGGSITPSGNPNRKPKIGVGSGAVGTAGGIALKIKLAVGAGAVSIAGLGSGILQAVGKFYQAVGGAAMSIAGGVGRKIRLGVGAGSVTPAGNPGRKTATSTGGGSVSISGDPNRKTKLSTGSGAVSSASDIGRKTKLGVGDGSVTSSGGLVSKVIVAVIAGWLTLRRYVSGVTSRRSSETIILKRKNPNNPAGHYDEGGETFKRER